MTIIFQSISGKKNLQYTR